MLVRYLYLLLAALLPGVVSAQGSLLKPPSGTQEYGVRGFYDGGEMEPWTSSLTVSDSTIGERAAVRAVYSSRFENGQYQFVHSASWLRADARQMQMKWNNGGHSVSSCSLSVENARLTGNVSSIGTIAPIVLSQTAVPDFALGAYFATLQLQDGDSLRITVVRCLPDVEGNPVQTLDITFKVRKATESRGDLKAQSAWLLEGSGSYPFKTWISTEDRMVLKMFTPQGSVGHSEDTFVRTAAAR